MRYNTPEKGTTDWDAPLNENFEQLDRDVEIRDVEANLSQYTPKENAKFFATDSGKRYLGDGSQWIEAPSQPLTKIVAPHTISTPEEANPGELWYREDLDELRTKVGDEIITLAIDSDESDDSDGSDATPLQQFTFNDPAPEALKHPDDRDRHQLVKELQDRGWDENVDNGDGWNVRKHLFYTPTDASPTVADSKEGQYSLECHHLEDENTGFDLQSSIHRDECWAQYWIKFEDEFDPNNEDYADWDTDGGKLPGWSGRYSCGGGGDGPCDGTDGWSARGVFHDPVRWGYEKAEVSGNIVIGYYVYHAEMDGQYGDTEPWLKNNEQSTLTVGEWHEITMHAKMNDVGQSNGVLEGWIDGTQEYGKYDWVFRTDESLDIKAWWHNYYFGGNWPSPKNQSIYTDDLRIYDQNPL